MVRTRALIPVLADEAQHAAFGGWFLDGCDEWLDDDMRAHLGRIAGAAVRSFAPLLATERAGAGVTPDDAYDACFLDAAHRRVAAPLAQHGIEIPAEDLTALRDA